MFDLSIVIYMDLPEAKKMKRHDRMMPLLLRIPEACDVIGIGRSKLYEILKSGELPAVRLGRSVRIRLSDLQAWVDRQ